MLICLSLGVYVRFIRVVEIALVHSFALVSCNVWLYHSIWLTSREELLWVNSPGIIGLTLTLVSMHTYFYWV